MHYIELLGAENRDFKIKFINLLKNKSIYSISELSSFYDNLLDSQKVIIEFKELSIESLDNLCMCLIDIDVYLGDSSFHEEFGANHLI